MLGSTAVNPPIPPQPLDERGFGRKAKCDIGAYESSPLYSMTATPTDIAVPTDIPTASQ